jgi:hypothetical protein
VICILEERSVLGVFNPNVANALQFQQALRMIACNRNNRRITSVIEVF